MSEVAEDRDGCEPVLLPGSNSSSLGTWERCWDGEDSSISRLNLDNGTRELQNIVEDKEIAARAVAFVVNSTRKGIVPLCADVATLLRNKRELELNVLALKRENALLRSSVASSIHTGHSTSPPPSIPDSIDLAHRNYSRSSSRSSSLISNSPRPDRVRHQKSPRLHRTSAFTVHEAGNRHSAGTTTAVVHRSNNGLPVETLGLPASTSDRRMGHERKGSLPEIVSVPQGHITKVNPKAKKVSKGTQCRLEEEKKDSPRSTHKSSERLSGNLASQLGAAEKEVAELRTKLQIVEMQYLARKYIGQFHIENECLPPAETSQDQPKARRHRHPSLTSTGPVVQAIPMRGCRCSRCDEIIRSDVEWDEVEAGGDCVNTLYKLGDHVVLDDERTGHVQYIGHLDNVGQTNFVFVGVELDAPVGHHDGLLNGRRYFSCADKYGIILPIQDILGIILGEKPVRKKFSTFVTGASVRPPGLQRSMSQEPVSPLASTSYSSLPGARGGSLPRTPKEGRRFSHSQELLSSSSHPFTHVLARSPSDSCKLAPNSTKYPARTFKERTSSAEKRLSSSDAGHHKVTETRYPSGERGNLKLPRDATSADLV